MKNGWILLLDSGIWIVSVDYPKRLLLKDTTNGARDLVITKARELYSAAHGHIALLPKSQVTRQLIIQAIAGLNAISETLAALQIEMNQLASQLPEYTTVMAIQGVGQVFGPQLMAEIGDAGRFRRKQSLVAFAGIDAPPYQSGAFESHSRSISKRGSPFLRKTLFQVMSCIMQSSSADNEMFQYLDKKRSEGKHFYVYMMAGANKFLRIYYARVKEHVDTLNPPEQA